MAESLHRGVEHRQEGERSPDGRPIELYRRLPSLQRAELIAAALSPGADVLELGCGTGRIIRDLARMGFTVTGIDNSAAMLRYATDLPCICADATELDLHKTFGAVILAGLLINDPSDARRRAFLRACARHVSGESTIVIECLDVGWFRNPPVGKVYELTAYDLSWQWLAHRIEDDLVTGTIRYTIGEQHWDDTFSLFVLEPAAVEALLESEGLRVSRWLRPNWLTARLCDDRP